jgi:hypothetical protein
MRKKQQDGKVGRWGRSSREGRLMDKKGTAGREGCWMRKEQHKREGCWMRKKPQEGEGTAGREG